MLPNIFSNLKMGLMKDPSLYIIIFSFDHLQQQLKRNRYIQYLVADAFYLCFDMGTGRDAICTQPVRYFTRWVIT